MPKPIPNYPGDKRSLVNDAIFLVHLRALNVAAGDRAVSFEQTWINWSDNPDFPMPYRTAQRCLKRMISVGFVHKRDRGGTLPSVYYALPCSLERMSYALQNGLDEWVDGKNGSTFTFYAPPDSPVCLTWADNCQCAEILVLAEQIPEDSMLTFVTPLRAILIPRHQRFQTDSCLLRWKRRLRKPYALYAAQYFIRQLRRFEGQLGGSNVWDIPSVKNILKEIERLVTLLR